jgi:hypothetical protein
MFTGTHRPVHAVSGSDRKVSALRLPSAVGDDPGTGRDGRRYFAPGGSARSSKPLNVKAGHTVAPIRA